MILSDTTLCAIVRDEAMNPAGGIIDFVDSTVPYVEQAVIVDTGSIDDTREMLEQLASEYDNLTIVDTKFTDYASARNLSLQHAKTKKVLILDADERLMVQDFQKLIIMMNKLPAAGYNFQIRHVSTDYEMPGIVHNPRLYRLNPRKKGYFGKVYYVNDRKRMYEWLYMKSEWGERRVAFEQELTTDSGIVIKHFLPSDQGQEWKNTSWYNLLEDQGENENIPAPAQQAHFAEWKKYNPRRELYR